MVHALILMSKLPIHQNLSTSFVNLSALVRHLRGLQFVGSVQIELSSYEAELEFTEEGSVRAREQDHIAGRLSFGEEALQRIMIRSKEPGGLIHVFKRSDEREEKVFVDRGIAEQARKMANGPAGKAALISKDPMQNLAAATAPAPAEAPIPKPNAELERDFAENNWSELLGLVSELMRTVDASLAKGNFDFDKAFRNACGFVSYDYPFLDPDSDVFTYSGGYISVRQRLAAGELVPGVAAALARIMQRLREDPYFGNTYHQTMHRLRVLAHRRHVEFETFGLARELQKIVGI